MKRVELLAPAGDMACFKAAVNAGADAIYLGGEEYGARAYASNFTTEELCEAICYAHLFDVKVYLTVNTLVKERELSGLCDFIRPFYEVGLDGVIIQDFGVLQTLKSNFPGLELHGSTQMCVTGKYGAELLKEYGVSRVVPAREVSLDEMKEIKATGIEVEAFIHGAMCYCYSGQCLFSSFLGGRSGNRGRCAGPCRLPYTAFGQKEIYPLSLKDMCTLPILHELLDADIDSFKIEGRMKNPYYVAGVTAIYRKYIDLYYETKQNGKKYKVDQKDLDMLRKLYVRTELETGYYHRHNGPEMITLDKPGYISGDENQLTVIKERFLDCDKKKELYCELKVKAGELLQCVAWDNEGHTVTVEGTMPIERATNRPATEEDIKKQLGKTGNTPFYFESITVSMDEDVFIPVKEMNDLRRRTLDSIKQVIVADDFRVVTAQHKDAVTAVIKRQNTQALVYRVCVDTWEQWNAIVACISQNPICKEKVDGIEISYALLQDMEDGNTFPDMLQASGESDIRLYLRLPIVGRRRAVSYCDKHLTEELLQLFRGFYCGNLDMLQYLLKRLDACGIHKEAKEIVADYSLYTSNHEAVSFLKQHGVTGLVASYELNRYEWKDLLVSCDEHNMEVSKEYPVYGHVPFMQTAGCLKKTFGTCDGQTDITMLTDRMGKKLPVVNHCEICENTIYNSVPLDLTKEIKNVDCDYGRVCFTIENGETVQRVLSAICSGDSLPIGEFTKGHFKKGVE